MQSHVFSGHGLLKAALAVLSIDVLLTLLISITRDQPEYLPSISEAGRFRAYFVYSRLGVVSSVLLFAGLVEYALHPPFSGAGAFWRWLTVICAFVATASFAFQAVVKIDLTTDHCAHRSAAGIFFLASYATVFAASFLDLQYGAKSVVRWALVFAIVAVMVWQERVFNQWSTNMSVTPLTLQQNATYITRFSLMQYGLAAALVMLFCTLLW